MIRLNHPVAELRVVVKNEFMIGDDYNTVEGYNPDADLGLGCGLTGSI